MLDSHHHLWDVSARSYDWLAGSELWASAEELAPLRRSFLLSELAPLAARAGVTATVVVQTCAAEWETRDMLALTAGQDPWGGSRPASALLAGVVGWTDLAAPGVSDALGSLRERPGGGALCGIRHPLLAEPDPDWLSRPDVRRGLLAVAAAGLCFDLVVRPDQLASAVAAARATPSLTFVLDHLGGPELGSGSQWADAIRELGALPNVACKLSGAHTDPPAGGVAAWAQAFRPRYEVVLAAFGPDRLMFGSDWPVSALTAPYPDVCDLYRALTADLTAAEQEAIFDRTARRVYHLRGAGYQPRDA